MIDSNLFSSVSSPERSLQKRKYIDTSLQDNNMKTTTSITVSSRNTLYMVKAATFLSNMDNIEYRMFKSSHMGDIQRCLDEDHLQELITYQKKYKEQYGEYTFPSLFYITRMNANKFALLDGQHRLEAIRRLLRDDYLTMINQNVLVSVFDIQDPSEYDELFVAINKNKPVQLYRNLCDWKSVLKYLDGYFMEQFAPYLKKTNRPTHPHFNLEALLHYIDDSDLIPKIGLGYEELINEIEELNTFYSENWKSYLHDTKYIKDGSLKIEKCKQKMPLRPYFLSIFNQFEWVDRICQKVNTPGLTYDKMKHLPKGFRQRIPKSLRRKVWEKRNARECYGPCRVCDSEIHFDSFESGHIMSVFHGGETNIKNLEPICKLCNTEMGIQNLDEFKQKYHVQH